MKTFFKLGLGMAAVLLASCSSNSLDEIAPQEEPSSFPEYNVTVTIPDIEPGEGETRTTLTPSTTSLSMSFAWAEGDVVGVYSPESSGGNLATFKIKDVSASDPKSANCDGGGFRLIGGYTYNAVYPYNGNAIEQSTIPVYYDGQNPLSNGGAEHLGPYDYMAASAVASGENIANFAFKHLSTFMRIRITVPKAGTYTSLSIKAPSNVFIMKGQINLLDANPAITCVDDSGLSSVINLPLGTDGSGITLTDSNLNLVVFVMFPPVNLSSQTLTFTLIDDEGNVSKYSQTGFNMLVNKVYGYIPTAIDSSISGSGSGYDWG